MPDVHAVPDDDDPPVGPAEPVCFEQVLADTGDVREHAEHRLLDHADLLGPLVVAASRLEGLRADLPAGTHALPVHLVADAADHRDGLTTLREARNGLFDDDRVAIAGVQLALPATADPAAAAALVLRILDFSAPAWLEVPLVDRWEAALDVVAADGTENVAVRGDAAPDLLAAFVHRAVALGLTFRVTGDVAAVRGSGTGNGAVSSGVLNLLCAVRAAADGAGTAEVAAVLAATAAAPLVTAARQMDAAAAGAARRLLAGVDASDVGRVVADLQGFGLL